MCCHGERWGHACYLIKKSVQFAFLSSIFVSFCSIFLHHHVVSLFSYRRSQGSCHENAVFFLKYFCIFNKVMHVFIFKSLHLHPPSEIAGLLPRATFHHGLPRERFAQQPLCASCFVLDTVLCVLPICVLCVTRAILYCLGVLLEGLRIRLTSHYGGEAAGWGSISLYTTAC